MDIEIIEQTKNPLLHREEIRFRIIHEEEATPSREVVAAKLAAIVNADRNRTVLKRIDGEFGSNKSIGYANVYDSVDDIEVEPKHILKRNGLLEEDA